MEKRLASELHNTWQLIIITNSCRFGMKSSVKVMLKLPVLRKAAIYSVFTEQPCSIQPLFPPFFEGKRPWVLLKEPIPVGMLWESEVG
ncbi:MAG: hypothetical protein DWH73_01455 [Planctomycetota bacterium]|nr:MAG: hypothetical protein DWH73_01455 [Planctomycetota bacterium]